MEITPNPPSRVREIVLVALGLAVFLTSQIALARPKALYNGPLWLDEYLTDLVVRDPSISHSIDAVRHGVDTNPPVYHLVLRSWLKLTAPIFRDSPRAAMRAFSTICIWLSLLGAYILLRKTFPPWPAIIGVLALWPHPDLIDQTIEARFYAPMLAATIGFCLAAMMPRDSITRGILLALTSALACTLHYFGILAIIVIAVAVLLVDEGSFKQRILHLLPALAGPIVLLPFVFFIKSQGAGLTVKTWLHPFSPRLAREFLEAVFYPLAMVIVLAVWWIARLLQKEKSEEPRNLWPMLPLIALASVPGIIIVFSALVQSALLSRYAITAVLAAAPVAALLANQLHRRPLIVMALGLIGLGFFQLRGESNLHIGMQQALDDQIATLRSDALPIIFADRGDACALIVAAPDLTPRVSILDLRQNGIELSRFRLYEIEMVGKVSEFYPMPPLIASQKLQGIGQFHLIAAPDDLSMLFREVRLKQIGDWLYEVSFDPNPTSLKNSDATSTTIPA
jgi:hypothetical protein